MKKSLIAAAGLLLAAATAQAAQETGINVRLPAASKVKNIEVWLDVEGSSAREEQVAENSDSLLSIGRVRTLVVDVQGGQMAKAKNIVDQPVLFYLYSPSTKISAFEINVQSAKTAEGFVTEGMTPKGFVVEAMQLNSVGEARGKTLKRFDDVSFKIGEPTVFPLNLEIPDGKTLGVRVWTQKGSDELSIQIKASKKGKFPAHILARNADGEAVPGEGCFNPDVTFSYRGAPAGGKFVTGNPLERLVDQINNYVKGQEGKSEVTVPLKLRVQTTGE